MQQKTFWMHREQQEYPIIRGRHSADAAVVGGGSAQGVSAFMARHVVGAKVAAAVAMAALIALAWLV